MTKCFYSILLSSFYLIQPLYSEDQANPATPPPSSPSEPPPFPFPEHADLPEPNFLAQFLYMLFMLGLLIGFLLFISWFLKRMMHTRIQQANTGSLIKVVESRTLSSKATVHVLEIEGKNFVLAEGPTSLVNLKPLELTKE